MCVCRLQDNDDEESTECLLTLIAQLDPKGWIWRSGGYQHLFLKEVSRAATTAITTDSV